MVHAPINHVQAGKLNLLESQQNMNYRMSKTVIVNPTSQAITPLNSGGFLDFRLTSSDRIKGVTFSITLQRDSRFTGTAGGDTFRCSI